MINKHFKVLTTMCAVARRWLGATASSIITNTPNTPLTPNAESPDRVSLQGIIVDHIATVAAARVCVYVCVCVCMCEWMCECVTEWVCVWLWGHSLSKHWQSITSIRIKRYEKQSASCTNTILRPECVQPCHQSFFTSPSCTEPP